MVVAVVAVRMVQVARYAVVDVIAVRDCLVAAIGAVDMAGRMPAAAVVRGAPIGVVAGDIDHMLIHMIVMRMVQVAVVQIIDVSGVPHGGVAATGSVLVSMVGMVRYGAGRHRVSSFPCPGSVGTAARPSAAWVIALCIKGSTCSSASV